MDSVFLQFLITTIISVSSVFAAIFIPWRIMRKQNNIAIFDKRFEIYKIVKKIIAFAEPVQKLKGLPNNPNPSSGQLGVALLSIWCNSEKLSNQFWKEDELKNNPQAKIDLINAIDDCLSNEIIILESSEFLFNKKAYCFIDKLKSKYSALIACIESSLFDNNLDNFDEIKTSFCNFINEQKENIKYIEKELKL